MKKKILFGLLLGLILYPVNKVTNYNISSVNYKEGNEVDNQIEVEWQKNWGGKDSDWFNSIIETQDGYIAVGSSDSNDIEGLTNKGVYDAIIIKYDKNGNIIWQKNHGGNDFEEFNSIIETQDGYVVVGKTSPDEFEGLTNKEYSDAIIIKFDKNGNIIWQKKYGGNSDDGFNSIIETQDGYVVVGETYSDEFEGLVNKGHSDAIIIKYDKEGNIIWQKNYGGNFPDSFRSIIETQDGYVVVGKTCPVENGELANSDAIIIKYDKNGNIIWQKNYGVNKGLEEFNSIIETQDGYVVVGYASFLYIEGLANISQIDAIIIKYDKNGNIIWKKNWGGKVWDEFNSIIETQDGYVVVGETSSDDIEGLTNKGDDDAIIIKYDKNGNIIWQKNYGGNDLDQFNSIIETQDGYVVVGETSSDDIEGLTNKGDDDAIIIKFKLNNTIDTTNNNEVLDSKNENSNDNVGKENINNNSSTDNINNNQETVVDAPNTLNIISKMLLIISGLLIIFGIGLYGYNLYKLKQSNNK